MSNITDREEIDLNSVLAQRVTAGQVLHVSGELNEVQAKLHAATVNRLMAETGMQVVVVHTPNTTSEATLQKLVELSEKAGMEL